MEAVFFNQHTGQFNYDRRNADDVVYLRKDALLEWAKGEVMPGNSAEGKGWNWALQILIDKIESL